MNRPPLRLLLPLFCVAALCACSMPRIIVLEDPLDARQHNDLGVAYEQRGEYDLALREYERAARLDPEWGLPLANRGNVLAARERWDEAAASYRSALEREPADAAVMNNLAWVLLQEGRLDAALEWSERAVAAWPDSPDFLDTLAAVHLARGEGEAAAEATRRALQFGPDPELSGRLRERLKTLEEAAPSHP